LGEKEDLGERNFPVFHLVPAILNQKLQHRIAGSSPRFDGLLQKRDEVGGGAFYRDRVTGLGSTKTHTTEPYEKPKTGKEKRVLPQDVLRRIGQRKAVNGKQPNAPRGGTWE